MASLEIRKRNPQNSYEAALQAYMRAGSALSQQAAAKKAFARANKGNKGKILQRAGRVATSPRKF